MNIYKGKKKKKFPSESQTMKLKYSKEAIMERTHYTLSKKV